MTLICWTAVLNMRSWLTNWSSVKTVRILLHLAHRMMAVFCKNQCPSQTKWAQAIVIALSGMLVSPESPRWLQSKGKTAAAAAAASKLWGPSGAAQLDEGSAAGSSRAAEPASLPALLKCKGAIIGIVLFMAQQLSGINAVVYFSSSTFAQALFLPYHNLPVFLHTATARLPGISVFGGEAFRGRNTTLYAMQFNS